jgi:hypothetical protein
LHSFFAEAKASAPPKPMWRLRRSEGIGSAEADAEASPMQRLLRCRGFADAEASPMQRLRRCGRKEERRHRLRRSQSGRKSEGIGSAEAEAEGRAKEAKQRRSKAKKEQTTLQKSSKPLLFLHYAYLKKQ